MTNFYKTGILYKVKRKNMKIIKAEVVIKSGNNDEVWLTTNLPSPYEGIVEYENEPLQLKFYCFRHQGAGYVRKYFDIEPIIISVS